MREALYTLAVLAASLLLIAGVVFGGYDRSTFVPVPEAVTESFTRQIVARRFDLAMNYLASQTRQIETPQTLAARFETLSSSTGKINQVAAQPQWMQQDHAAARATIEGDSGETSFDIRLVRENGLWRIDQLPDLVR
jgi:hypothetical protein